MNKYKTKSFLLMFLLFSNAQKTFSMSFFVRNSSNKPIQSSYEKQGRISLFHKFDAKNVHIFNHKDTKKPLSANLHKKAYEKSLHHEFPTAHHYNKTYNPITCETKALQNVLSKENPEIEAFWIPKTLYELFVIYEYENNHLEYTGYKQNLEGNNFERLLIINQNPRNINLHKQINDAILTFLQQHPQQKNQEQESYFINLAENLISQLPFDIQKLKEEIIKAIKEEYNHHKHNPESFLLYRSGPLDKRDFNIQANYALNHTKKEKPELPLQVSLSFGAGFFTAYYTDRGACAATMLCKTEKPYSYTLPVNKKDIITDKSPFFIPPLAPIPAFFSSGEAFHGRTKTAGYIRKPDGWCTTQSPLPKILSQKISINPFTQSTEIKIHYKNLYKNIIQKAIPLNEATKNLIETIQKRLPEE